MTKQRALLTRISFERRTEQAKNARTAFLREHSIAILGSAASIVVAGTLVISVVSGPSVGRQRILEATVRMERLAATLGRAQAVPMETAQQITQFMLQPQYDCDNADCGAFLHKRNRSARAQLQAVLAKNALPEEIAARNFTQFSRTDLGAK